MLSSDQSPSTWLIVFGPGGVGKGTISSVFLDRRPNFKLSKSWTSRPRRLGETDRDYVFVSRPEFEAGIRNETFLEWTRFMDHYYGTPTPDEGHGYIFDVEAQGVSALKAANPTGSIAVLLLPPSWEELRRRLSARGDSDEAISARLKVAKKEVNDGLGLADYVVANQVVEAAVDNIEQIVSAHETSVHNKHVSPSEILAQLRRAIIGQALSPVQVSLRLAQVEEGLRRIESVQTLCLDEGVVRSIVDL